MKRRRDCLRNVITCEVRGLSMAWKCNYEYLFSNLIRKRVYVFGQVTGEKHFELSNTNRYFFFIFLNPVFSIPVVGSGIQKDALVTSSVTEHFRSHHLIPFTRVTGVSSLKTKISKAFFRLFYANAAISLLKVPLQKNIQNGKLLDRERPLNNIIRFK